MSRHERRATDPHPVSGGEHLASDATMINRRDVLKAVAPGALWFPSGSARAQSRPSRTVPKKKPITSHPAPAEVDTRVNDVLTPIRDEHHLPGLIGAILRGDRLAAIGGIGIRKIGSSEPSQVTDQMHLGSCTKAMTATMIGSLVEEGKLSWKSTFRELFPESAELFHPQYQAVTHSQLLTHRAGLPHDAGRLRHNG